jgi:hypothetical protein
MRFSVILTVARPASRCACAAQVHGHFAALIQKTRLMTRAPRSAKVRTAVGPARARCVDDGESRRRAGLHRGWLDHSGANIGTA